MNRIYLLAPIVLLVLFLSEQTPLFATEHSLDDAIKKGATSGHIRFGYISSDPDVPGTSRTTGTAIGGFIKFETAEWQRFSVALAPFFLTRSKR